MKVLFPCVFCCCCWYTVVIIDRLNPFNSLFRSLLIAFGLALIWMLSFIYYLHRCMIEHSIYPLINTCRSGIAMFIFPCWYIIYAICNGKKTTTKPYQWRLLWAINYFSFTQKIITRTEIYHVAMVMCVRASLGKINWKLNSHSNSCIKIKAATSACEHHNHNWLHCEHACEHDRSASNACGVNINHSRWPNAWAFDVFVFIQTFPLTNQQQIPTTELNLNIILPRRNMII